MFIFTRKHTEFVEYILLTHFIKPHILAQSDDILSIDVEDSTNYKESLSVHTGYSTKQYPPSKDLVETSKYTKFLKDIQTFHVKTCSYLLKSMSVLCDPTVKCLSVFLNSAERVNNEGNNLTLLKSQFSLVASKGNAGKLQE